MSGLKISDSLTLPIDTVTSTVIIYGGKGMGKTNLGAVLAEELDIHKQRWAWLDPLGVSWGLRHSRDGKGRGVECLILGGLHGDVPIEPTGGAAVADVVVEEAVNVLIDFSRKPNGEMWSQGEKMRFVTAYATRLFQRQGEILNGRRRQSLFQILDEAARYIPQNIQRGDSAAAESVGAWNVLVEEGRNIGLGVGLLTQRSARMNKSVSELADAMIAFRTIGPNSLDSVLDWLGKHIEKDRIKSLAETIRTLDRGQALIVSPGWLKTERVVQIRLRHTFDSSATPKPGAPRVRGDGAKPDLVKIKTRMAETIERTKHDDPRELRKIIADRDRELKSLRSKPDAPAAPRTGARVEVPVLTDHDRAQLLRLTVLVEQLREDVANAIKTTADLLPAAVSQLIGSQLQAVAATARDTVTKANRILEKKSVENLLQKVEKMLAARPDPVTPLRQAVAAPSATARPQRPRRDVDVEFTAGPRGLKVWQDGDLKIGPYARTLLTVLASRKGQDTNKTQLAVLAGKSGNSSTFDNNLGVLRSAGFVDGFRITPEGIEWLGPVDTLPTGRALVDHWLPQLATTERLMLTALTQGDRAFDKSALAEACQRSHTSSTFDNAIGKLRTLGLATKGWPVRATPDLF